MILPTDHRSELALLGCCLCGGLETSMDVVERIPAAAFTNQQAVDSYAVITDLVVKGDLVNSLNFVMEWRKRYGEKGLPMEVITAEDKSPGGHMWEHFGKFVSDNYRRRKIILAIDATMQKAQDVAEPVDAVIAHAEQAIGEQEIAELNVFDGKRSAREMVADLERRLSLNGTMTGIETGLYEFDRMTDGLQYGEQTIIAARPSMGKTAFGLAVLQKVCLLNKIPSLFVTCEMSVTALTRRMFSSYAAVSMGLVRSGKFTESHFPKVHSFAALMAKSPLFIIEAVSGIDCHRLSAAIRRHARKHGIKLVIIDYLQKILPNRKQEKRTYEIAEVSGTLKALAVQTGAAFLTLAQVNRESEKDKGRMPRLADLADSGQIERDADTVGLLHRKREANEIEAKLVIAKQRDGEVGIVNLEFINQFCRFQNPGRQE